MNQYDSPITSIPGISSLTAAQLIAEFEDISRFDNPNQMLAYSGLEPSRSESGTMGKNGKITVVEDGERGKKVLSVHALLPNEKEYAGMRQRIRLSEVIGTLAPGETAYFTYSAYCRRLNVVGRGVNIGVDFYKKGVRSQWNETPYRSGSSNWERMTVSRKIAPDTDELVVNCNFAPKTTGTFLMDDISLAIEVRKKEEMGL